METLTPAEVAVVAGVPIRDVNRVVDEQILPAEFYSVGADHGRRFHADACSLIAFYFQAAGRLTPEERLRTITASQVQKSAGTRAEGTGQFTVRSDFLTIDLTSFVEETGARLARLMRARAFVVEDTETLSGTPVIRGTRLPVYDLAASVRAGLPVERILAAYPGLSAEDLELAALYAEANPLRGRRRRVLEVPVGAVVIAESRHARRASRPSPKNLTGSAVA